MPASQPDGDGPAAAAARRAPATPASEAVSCYDHAYFAELRAGTWRSARAVVPLLVKALRPRSVVDVGCGTGIWLAAFAEHGVHDALGVDGPWLERQPLAIPRERFVVHDLTTPLRLRRRFDLVLCVEVAEHLPPEAAATLVATLTALGSVVVFSAAIPDQGGELHVNEAWPQYWRDLFAERRYRLVDRLRGHVWNDDEVEVWYRQNLLIYAAEEEHAALASKVAQEWPNAMLAVVHPGLFEMKTKDLQDHAESLHRDWKRLLSERATLRERNDELQRQLAAATATLAELRRPLPVRAALAGRRLLGRLRRLA